MEGLLSSIDWSAVFTGAASFIVMLILKSLLDLNMAHLFVKYLSFLPVRNVFREKPTKLSGSWEILWEHGGSERYADEIDRHGHPEIKQLGSYIYFEFYSKQIKYSFFGCIQSGYIVGDWFDTNDKNGYFGVFQFEIVNSNELKGSWLGHSKSSREIRTDKIVCNRVQG
ncbi:hypothetical protein QTU68_004178 [Vibrio vulnificus]|nr:hypothetical protein [Vibrio vulnificus]ELP8109749.1 hypothetical protein [Vibrio vulnificus]